MGDLARSGNFDHIVIESTGIFEPMPVAATIEWEWEDGTRLADVAPIDTMVSLVDAVQFIDQLGTHRRLTGNDLGATPEDECTIADLLIDQTEFADRIYITKSDLVSEERYRATEALVRRLNPRASIDRLVNGRIKGESVIGDILGARLFSEATARTYQGYTEELANPHTPEAEEYGISSVIFKGERPFDRVRLVKTLRATKGLVRSKSYCWIADQLDIVQVWHQAGPDLSISPAAQWGADRTTAG